MVHLRCCGSPKSISELKGTENSFNNTHREKAPSNKSSELTKSTNMSIWVAVHQINSLYKVLKLKQKFRTNKVVNGKILFFVIAPFCSHHSFCLNISFWYAFLYGNDAFSILVLSNKKRNGKSFLFPENVFQS